VPLDDDETALGEEKLKFVGAQMVAGGFRELGVPRALFDVDAKPLPKRVLTVPKVLFEDLEYSRILWLP